MGIKKAIAAERPRRQWDGHCPECHSDDVQLDFVRRDSLLKHCAECGHIWNEERAEPEILVMGNVVGSCIR